MKKKISAGLLAVLTILLASCATEYPASPRYSWVGGGAIATFVIEDLGLRIEIPHQWITRTTVTDSIILSEGWGIDPDLHPDWEYLQQYATAISSSCLFVLETFRYDADSDEVARMFLLRVTRDFSEPETSSEVMMQLAGMDWRYSDTSGIFTLFKEEEGRLFTVITIHYQDDEELQEQLDMFRAYDEPAVAVSVEPETYIVPMRGIWDGNTYASAYFGLRFDMPEHWTDNTGGRTDVMSLTLGRDGIFRETPVYPYGAVIPCETIELHGAFADLSVHDGEWATRVHLVISDGKMNPFAPPVRSFHSSFVFDDIYDTVFRDDIMRIGNLDWQVVDRLDRGDGEIRMRHMGNMDGDFMRMITIFVQSSDQLDDILSMFRPY